MTARAKATFASATATLLAAASLGAVLPDQRWWVPVTFAVLVASACGALGRRLSGPAPLLPLITPLGLVVVVTAVGAAQTAWLGFIPRTATLHALRTLVRSGLDDVRQYAPPVPTTHGLMLLAAAGVYVVAAVVDLLAVTARRPAIAGIPLLVLVGVPAIERNGGVGVVRITLAALGWLLLLAVDGRERLAGWGRALGHNPIAEGSAALGGSAGRVAGVSLVAALLVPVVVPPVQDNALSGHGRASGCCSSGTLQIVAPLTTIQNRLHGRDVTLLRVSTDDPEYLRLTSLDRFDGNQFTQTSDTSPTGADVHGTLPDVQLPPTWKLVHLQARGTASFGENLLPLPYQPTSVTPASGHWVLAPRLRVLFAPDKDTTQDLSYRATSVVATPSAAQLAADGSIAQVDARLPGELAIDTDLPHPVPPAITQLAQQVTARASTTYEAARALEQYFATSHLFTYDLGATVASGYSGLVDFLARTRRGYCEQFASAYVVLARALGIPARVAVGFTPGTQQADGTWLVSTHDAHAWPEVWFPSTGWVRFEPTPRPDTSAFLPGYDSAGIAPTTPLPSLTVPSDAAGRASASPHAPNQAERDRSPGTALAPTHHRSWFWPVALLVLVAALAAPGLLGALARRARWSTAGHDPTRVAHAAWAALHDAMTDTGVPLRASETPRTTSRRLGELLRGAVDEPLARLAGAQESARYAPAGAAGLDVGGLRADVHAVRLALLSRLTPGPRLRARFLPPSVVDRVRAARTRLAGLGRRGRS